MKIKILVVAVLAIVVFCGWFVMNGNGIKNNAETNMNNPEIEKLKNQVAKLRVENKNLNLIIQKMEDENELEKVNVGKLKVDKEKVNEPGKIEEKEVKEELTFEEQYQRTLEMDRKVAEELDKHLSGEMYDDTWAPETENKIKEAMADTISMANIEDASLVDATCKSTLCRTVFSFKTTESKEKFVAMITMKEPFNTSGWIHSEGLEDHEIEIYFSKRGQSLPEISVQ